jgi:2-hydroxy-3-keto-5-methylthiopentenyl-1-phosphate phosphatase
MNQQKFTIGDKMSDYKEGFQDGITFAREVIIENIRNWAEDHENGDIFDEIADRIETGKVMEESEDDE